MILAAAGITVPELSRRTGIPMRRLVSQLYGVTCIDVNVIYGMSKAMDVDLVDVFLRVDGR